MTTVFGVYLRELKLGLLSFLTKDQILPPLKSAVIHTPQLEARAVLLHNILLHCIVLNKL